MDKNKFKVGDILTVADPKDPSHFKRFQKVIGTLPVEDGLIPYSLKSMQTGGIIGPGDLNVYLPEIMKEDKLGLYTFRSIEHDFTSVKNYFESMYQVLTEQEKLIYTNE